MIGNFDKYFKKWSKSPCFTVCLCIFFPGTCCCPIRCVHLRLEVKTEDKNWKSIRDWCSQADGAIDVVLSIWLSVFEYQRCSLWERMVWCDDGLICCELYLFDWILEVRLSKTINTNRTEEHSSSDILFV